MRHGLTFYAELPARRARQIAGDVLVLVWVAAWVLVGQQVHDRAKSAGEGAQKLETAGGDFSGSMGEAGSKLRKVPVIGEDIEEPFRKASAAGDHVAQAGTDIQLGADQLGQLLGLLTAALPICLVVALWARSRWRYAQRVKVARALEGYTGPDVEAIRLLVGLDRASLGLQPRTAPSVSAPLPTVTGPQATTSPPPDPSDQP